MHFSLQYSTLVCTTRHVVILIQIDLRCATIHTVYVRQTVRLPEAPRATVHSATKGIDVNTVCTDCVMVWFESFYVRVSTIYIYKLLYIHSAQSSLMVTHSGTNRAQRTLTSVIMPLN